MTAEAPARVNYRLLGGIAALVAMLALAAYFFTNGDNDATTPGGGSGTTLVAGATIEEQRSVAVVGDALAGYPGRSAPDPAMGIVAPEVRGASFDGSPVAIAADGTPKVVVFLAHWCPHCQAEVPRIVEWMGENSTSGVRIIGVATGTAASRPNYPPSRWLDRERFDVDVIADDKEFSTSRAFGLSGFPYFVALDGQNNVVARASGEIGMTEFGALVAKARGAGVRT